MNEQQPSPVPGKRRRTLISRRLSCKDWASPRALDFWLPARPRLRPPRRPPRQPLLMPYPPRLREDYATRRLAKTWRNAANSLWCDNGKL